MPKKDPIDFKIDHREASHNYRYPAFYVFRLKRHVTLLGTSDEETGIGRIVQGTYQSPILLQHQRPDKDVRCLEITLRRFE